MKRKEIDGNLRGIAARVSARRADALDPAQCAEGKVMLVSGWDAAGSTISVDNTRHAAADVFIVRAEPRSSLDPLHVLRASR